MDYINISKEKKNIIKIKELQGIFIFLKGRKYIRINKRVFSH